MRLFTYDADQRAAILASLQGVVHFGTHRATDEEVVAALEACASRYIRRKRMTTVPSLRKKLDALGLVASLLSDPSDNHHRERIAREIRDLESEMALIERPREHYARLKFMVDAFEIFARAEEIYSPLVDTIALSDSNSPARCFFDAAIAPACLAAGEPLQIRAAINALNVFKAEMFQAEINLIRSEIEYAANDLKS